MYDLWREQFGGDPGIVGKTIRLNGFPFTVLGVMPKSFHMPAVQTMATIIEKTRPLSIGVPEPLAFSKERHAEEMVDLNYFGYPRPIPPRLPLEWIRRERVSPRDLTLPKSNPNFQAEIPHTIGTQ